MMMGGRLFPAPTLLVSESQSLKVSKKQPDAAFETLRLCNFETPEGPYISNRLDTESSQ
jgi:hypothetical protein